MNACQPSGRGTGGTGGTGGCVLKRAVNHPARERHRAGALRARRFMATIGLHPFEASRADSAKGRCATMVTWPCIDACIVTADSSAPASRRTRAMRWLHDGMRVS